MLSRSAVMKLKAILIVDLIVVASAAGTYLYLLNEGTITGAAKPATFTLSDLTVNPNEAFVGETVLITVNVTNIGDVEGNTTVTLEINGVLKDSANLTLSGLKSSEIIEFSVIEMNPGNYSIKIGDLLSSYLIKELPPDSSKIVLSSFKATPFEVWPGQEVTITANAQNPSEETDRLFLRVMVDGLLANTTIVELEAGASTTLSFVVNSTTEGKHTVKLNNLQGSFTIVKEGYHTLTISRTGGGSKSLPFTLNGEEHQTPYQAVLPVGEYSISVPTPFDVGTGVLAFSSWSDGVKSSSRTFTLNDRMILVVTYNLISGYASCPSLFIWNGSDYVYVTEIANSGWLGYIDHINSDGTIVFAGGTPWDYIKLDKNVLAITDGYFDMALFQQWDELFYVDSAHMLVIDHPIGTDVYTTMSNHLNKGLNDQVYTVDKNNLIIPLNATNEKGENVLAQISQIDGVFISGSNGLLSPSWDNLTLNQLTLNLGDLSSAKQIKLVMNGMVDWGEPGPYYTWIDQFKAAAAKGLVADGTEIYPEQYIEVIDADGNWVRVPQERQIPMPADYRARSYAVNLTGLFPEGIKDYQVRMNNFWNVSFDCIAVDISEEQQITVQKITPTGKLTQIWETPSTSTGAFTRYGDVTPLLQEADDMYVIGRQGDQIDLKFSTADLTPIAEGMERDYFLIVSCWFKDPPGGWGYMFDFTVDPLPFIAMSGYPYTSAESYPYDAEHMAYLKLYNTRVFP